MMKSLVLERLEALTTEDGIRYRHPLVRWILMTEGVTRLATTCEAFWLLNVIALTQGDVPAVAKEPFQSWCRTVAADQPAVLTCAHFGDRTVFSLPIPFTDFPQWGITLWFIDNVILLPSEYH